MSLSKYMFWCENYLFRNTLTDMKTRFFVKQKTKSFTLHCHYKYYLLNYINHTTYHFLMNLINNITKDSWIHSCVPDAVQPVAWEILIRCGRGGGVILSSHCRLCLNAISYLISILDTHQCPDHCVDSLSVIFLREAPNSPMSTPCTRAVQVSIFL